MFDSNGIFLSHIDVPVLCSNSVGTDKHSLEDSVGITFQNSTVHKGTGVPLVCIADNILGPSLCLPSESPFHSCGKTGTTPASQLGPCCLIDHLLWCHPGEGLDNGLISTGGDIMLNLCGIDSSTVGQHPSHLFLIKGDLTPVIDGISCLGIPVSQVIKQPVLF